MSFFLFVGFVRRRWWVSASSPLLTSFVLAVVDRDSDVHILIQGLQVSVLLNKFILNVLLQSIVEPSL